ncbi:hypothetical protein RI367_002635 [Sorochytrium milnesiophthora]
MAATTSSSSLSEQLARLPPELIDLILSFAGFDVCAAARHLPYLRNLLRDYTTRGNYSIVYERRLLKKLLDAGWSAGVQLYFDHDLLGAKDRACSFFDEQPPLCWDRVTLPVSTLQKLKNREEVGEVPFDVLTYNLFASGAAVSQWMSRHGIGLGGQLIKRGASIDRLREVCRLVNGDSDDRRLASTFLPHAARHGRMDLVVFWDTAYPELLRGSNLVLRQAVEGGHLDMVKYAYERQQQLQPDLFEIAAHHGYESVARWLFDQSPGPVKCRPALDLAQHNCANLLQFLRAGAHLELPASGYSGDWGYLYNAAGRAGSQSNNPKVWRILLDWFRQAGGYLLYHDCGQSISAESIKWLIKHNGASAEEFIDTLAAAGRVDVVKWIFAEYPPVINPRPVVRALAAGHVELAQWMARELGLPLTVCRPAPEQLRHVVLGGRLDVLQWIEEHCGGGLPCTPDLFLAAVNGRNLGIILLLRAQNPDMDITSTMLERACDGGNLALVRWIYHNLTAVEDWDHDLVANRFPEEDWSNHSTTNL